mmetsp:Transcript_1730/g.3741  ORF Transcript_1730/g.3741 Transcript_1730/m.3741 type:complete len:259 (-) Transcript_1730:774-1550(-)
MSTQTAERSPRTKGNFSKSSTAVKLSQRRSLKWNGGAHAYLLGDVSRQGRRFGLGGRAVFNRGHLVHSPRRVQHERRHAKNGDKHENRAHGEHRGGGHIAVQHCHHDDVQRQAEEVHDRGPRFFRHVSRPERPHGGEIHAADHLESKEPTIDSHGRVGENGKDERGSCKRKEVAQERLDLELSDKQREQRRPDHDGDHERGEDHSVRNLGCGRCLERWSPHEHKSVHSAFKRRLDRSDQQNTLVRHHICPRLSKPASH